MCVTGKSTGEAVLDAKVPKIPLNATRFDVSNIKVCIREDVSRYVFKTDPPRQPNLIRIIKVEQDSDLKCF